MRSDSVRTNLGVCAFAVQHTLMRQNTEPSRVQLAISLRPSSPPAWGSLLLAFALIGAEPSIAQQGHTDQPHSWTYSGEAGPEHWADLSPEFETCGRGKNQSPVDITGARLARLPEIRFSYALSPLAVIDNGHTIQVNYAPGSTITVDGTTYELVQFHFHHPSEEKIDGKAFDMVAHLVHRNGNGQLAVVAVLLTSGIPNRLIETIWNNLPSEKGKELKSVEMKLNAADLLPPNRAYYTLQGSLTTPPCTEGVTWYVLQTPVPLSQPQIDKFASIYPLNARPVQPLNRRTVQESNH